MYGTRSRKNTLPEDVLNTYPQERKVKSSQSNINNQRLETVEESSAVAPHNPIEETIGATSRVEQRSPSHKISQEKSTESDSSAETDSDSDTDCDETSQLKHIAFNNLGKLVIFYGNRDLKQLEITSDGAILTKPEDSTSPDTDETESICSEDSYKLLEFEETNEDYKNLPVTKKLKITNPKVNDNAISNSSALVAIQTNDDHRAQNQLQNLIDVVIEADKLILTKLFTNTLLPLGNYQESFIREPLILPRCRALTLNDTESRAEVQEIENISPVTQVIASEHNITTPIVEQSSDSEIFYTPVGDSTPFNESIYKKLSDSCAKRPSTNKKGNNLRETPKSKSIDKTFKLKPKNLMKNIKLYDSVGAGCSKYPTNQELDANESSNENPPENITLKSAKKNPKVPSHIMSFSNQTLSLRDALAVVPNYDGHDLSLGMFIQGCKEALAMLGPYAESNLVKAVRIKIIGEPRRSIQAENFNTIEEMNTFLKNIYAPTRNIYQLQGELGSIYQKENESVISYSNRVRDLGNLILDSYETKIDQTLNDAFAKNTKASLPACFLHGLKPEIESRLKMINDLEELINLAIQTEKQLASQAILRQVIREPLNLEGGKVESKRKIHVINSEVSNCQLCDEPGHLAKQCPKTKKGEQVVSNPGDDGKNPIVCQVCKKLGHAADRCFQLYPPAGNNRAIVNTTQLTICQVCDKRGHTAERCFKIFPPQGRDMGNVSSFCQLCKNRGHSANNCPQLPNKPPALMSLPRAQVPQNLRFQGQNDIVCQICKKMATEPIFAHIVTTILSH